MSLINAPWPGIIKLFPARESLVSNIPAGDGKIAKRFLHCILILSTHFLFLVSNFFYLFILLSFPILVSCLITKHFDVPLFCYLPSPIIFYSVFVTLL